MASMQSFVSWFLTQLPNFLLAEPICYLFGFVLLGITIKIIVHMVNGNHWS